MPQRLNTIVGSFSHGEITPFLFGRMETTRYKQGVSLMRNMVANQRGPVRSRVGYLHNTRVLNQTNTKLHAFTETGTSGFACAFFEDEVKVIADALETYGPNNLINGEFTNGLASWVDESVAPGAVAVVDETLVLTPTRTAGKVGKVSQAFLVPDAAATYDFRFVGTFPGLTATEGVLVELGTTLGGDDLHSDIHCCGQTLHHNDIVAPGVTTLYLTITALDWSASPGVSSTASTIDDIIFREVLPAGTSVDLVSAYKAADIDTLVFKMVPGDTKAYITHNNYPPRELVYDPLLVTWVLQDIVFVSQPATWAVGNYPGTVEFFQGRSWWGGYTTNPETLNASKSSLFADFSVSAPLVDDDALEFTLSTKGQIKWIVGAKNLLVGTESAEFILTSTGGVITPSDIGVELQSAHGSSHVVPLLVGTECAFIPLDQKQVRTMGYNWKESGWIADEISLHGHHLFSAKIVQAYQSKSPDQVLWFVLADGSLVGCTYEQVSSGESRIVGWHKHQIDLSLKSAIAIETGNNSELWVATAVNIDGVNEIHIGHLSVDENSTPARTDSAVRQQTDPATNIVTGLGHLEGREVTIVMDGAVYGTEVVSGGQLTLSKTGSNIEVGIGFTARLATLPVRFYTADGAFYHAKKRHNKIFVQLLDSAIPKINGVRPPDRSPTTPLNTVQPLTSELVQVANLGWDDEAIIAIEQDLPLPLTIIAVVGEMAMEQI